MLILLICCILLTTGYALLMLIYRYGWKKQANFIAKSDFQPSTGIAVIIPARNEAANIEACIRSIMGQDYPQELVEIIVVDDHSEDNTAALAAAMGSNIQIISLQAVLHGEEATNAYKKKALNAGIANSHGALIITTDADCIAPPAWLKQMAALYERTHAAMIIGPVAFTTSGAVVSLFQSLDFMTMQGITAAAQQLKMGSMANGANLAFSRAAFIAVNGYTGIDQLASGDDYLLLHKMQQKFPEDIYYLKSGEAIIRTAPQPGWSTFLQQRIRWASKSGKYSDHKLTAILALVYLFNIALFGSFIAAFLVPGVWFVPAGMVAVKIISELIFLFPVSAFFDKRPELFIFPLLQPLHIFYIILAGFLGMIGGYRWKGRRVR